MPRRYLSPLLKAVVRKLECAAVLSDRAHDVLGGSLGQLGMDLHCDLDPGAEQTAQVLRDLLDHRSGIAHGARRIERDGAVEALWLWPCRRGRSLCGFVHDGVAVGRELSLVSTRRADMIRVEAAGAWRHRGGHICRDLRCGNPRLDEHSID